MSEILNAVQGGLGTVEQGAAKFGLPVLLGGSTLWGAISCFKTIHEGEAGVRTRRGNARRPNNDLNRVYGPGLVAKFPGLGEIVKIDTTRRSDHIPSSEFNVPLTIDRAGGQYSVAASVIWRVQFESRDEKGKKYGKYNPYAENVYKALYESQSPTGDALTRVVVDTYCRSGIRQVMETLSDEKFKVDREVQGGVKEIVDDILLENYGVELLAVTIGNVALTGAEKMSKAISSLNSSDNAPESTSKMGAIAGSFGQAAEELYGAPDLMLFGSAAE